MAAPTPNLTLTSVQQALVQLILNGTDVAPGRVYDSPPDAPSFEESALSCRISYGGLPVRQALRAWDRQEPKIQVKRLEIEAVVAGTEYSVTANGVTGAHTAVALETTADVRDAVLADLGPIQGATAAADPSAGILFTADPPAPNKQYADITLAWSPAYAPPGTTDGWSFTKPSSRLDVRTINPGEWTVSFEFGAPDDAEDEARGVAAALPQVEALLDHLGSARGRSLLRSARIGYLRVAGGPFNLSAPEGVEPRFRSSVDLVFFVNRGALFEVDTIAQAPPTIATVPPTV